MKNSRKNIKSSRPEAPPLLWQIPAAPRAVLVIIHGLGEHGGRYRDMMQNMAKHHIACLAVDLPGHGQSPEARGVVTSYQDLRGAVTIALTAARARFKDLPLTLYGHSMGGGVVLTYGLNEQGYSMQNYSAKGQPETAAASQEQIDGYIVSAPLILPARKISAALRLITKIMRPVFPRLVLKSGLKPDQISNLEHERKIYADDPLNHDCLGLGLAVDMIENGEWLQTQAENWNAPLLIMHAKNDKLTNFNASKDFAVKAKNCAFIGFDDAQHEIHNDITRQEVYAAMRLFIGVPA